jgi:hypothetical protein
MLPRFKRASEVVEEEERESGEGKGEMAWR